MLVAVFGACAPPDAPDRLDRRLPEAVSALLEPDSVRTVELHPGVEYRYLWSPRGPWAVHLVRVDLAAGCELGFDVLRAEERERGRSGRETVSGMAARAGPALLAAVNADFFTEEGAALGAEVVDGVVTAVASRPTFAWRPGSEPWLGVARSDGLGLAVGWPVEGADGRGTDAVGGFPDLIDGGRRVGDLEVDARPSFAAARHPRTAVGYDVDGGRIWLVVVDGRQPPHSVGMTLPELATLLEALGAEEALNLDGGGSTTLVVADAVMNRPSDATGERPVVNALAVVRAPSQCVRDVVSRPR